MRIILFSLLALMVFFGCKKNYQLPEDIQLAQGPSITIQQLKTSISANSVHRFSGGDTTLLLTIVMDESSGNSYKTVYAADEQGQGIQLKLLNSGGLYTGDKIRMNLNGLYLACINNQLYFDSLDISKSVLKLSSGNAVSPLAITMADLQQHSDVREFENLQSRFVRISDIEFVSAAKGKQLANNITKTSAEYAFGLCAGSTITLKTSGFARFAGTKIPAGHGDISGILTQYNNAYTLILRSDAEMNLSAASCAPPDTASINYFLYKDFDDQSISSSGWQSISKQGSTTFSISNFAQATYYARIYNKNGSNYEQADAWLLSPSIDLQTAKQPVLNFKTANSTTTASLSALVSDNYGAADESWQTLNFTIQKNSFTYCPSGDIDLSAYKGKTIRIAFRYTAPAGSGSIWNLDEVILREKQIQVIPKIKHVI